MYSVRDTTNCPLEPFVGRDDPSPELGVILLELNVDLDVGFEFVEAHPQFRAGSVQRVTCDQAGQARFSRPEKVLFSVVSGTD